MNLIKEIEPGSRDEINVIIEINKGSKNKYEIDKKTGLISLDRAMHTAQDYPYDYGFVPQTLWDDGDPLDVLVLTTYALLPGILVKVRPVAVMNMVDGGDSDAKIIAVPVHDPRWDHVQDLNDVNKHTIKEIEHFYKTYKGLSKKTVEINGTEGAEKAKEAFDKAVENYKSSQK
jgi:inorganic pyrophosphatase